MSSGWPGREGETVTSLFRPPVPSHGATPGRFIVPTNDILTLKGFPIRLYVSPTLPPDTAEFWHNGKMVGRIINIIGD